MLNVKDLIDNGVLTQSQIDDLPCVWSPNTEENGVHPVELGIYQPIRFANFFYFHGELENFFGYDCIEGDIDFFHSCMHIQSVFAVKIVSKTDVYIGICFVGVESLDRPRLRGFVVSPDDTDAINYCLRSSSINVKNLYVTDEVYTLLEKYNPSSLFKINYLKH